MAQTSWAEEDVGTETKKSLFLTGDISLNHTAADEQIYTRLILSEQIHNKIFFVYLV